MNTGLSGPPVRQSASVSLARATPAKRARRSREAPRPPPTILVRRQVCSITSPEAKAADTVDLSSDWDSQDTPGPMDATAPYEQQHRPREQHRQAARAVAWAGDPPKDSGKKRRGVLCCPRDMRARGEALAYEAVGGGRNQAERVGGDVGLLRRVSVRDGSELYRAATESGEDGDPSGEVELIEVPAGWEVGQHVSQGQGRWVPRDGLVYASLSCQREYGAPVHVGEKALAAGPGRVHLIGRSWFFPSAIDMDRAEISVTRAELLFAGEDDDTGTSNGGVQHLVAGSPRDD